MKRREGVVTGIAKQPVAFGVVFFAFFVLTYAFLSYMGATPDPLEPTSGDTQTTSTPAPTGTAESPVRVAAPAIGLDVAVVNPTSTDDDVLDQALTQGALRYPTSAALGVNGTVVLFGHSSYLPVVYHQYYKTFDGIQNLKAGEIVSVYSASTEYRYKVTGVRVADATEDVIPLNSDAQYLTLVTCDSFSKKTNRFVVSATFVGAYER